MKIIVITAQSFQDGSQWLVGLASNDNSIDRQKQEFRLQNGDDFAFEHTEVTVDEPREATFIGCL
jgi:hypothetical protein